MRIIPNKVPASGWVGGFEQTNASFAYPDPDLSSLHMCDNMDNIKKLERQQAAIWPEFSWETDKDAPDKKRCYQMFAPDISRIGYTDKGRVYSIMCPQQGIASESLGAMNVEVTVTGTRGWVDESSKQMAADLTVSPKIWFSPSADQFTATKMLKKWFADQGLPFPFNKPNAIVLDTYKKGDPSQPIFPLRTGLASDFEIPKFTKHPEAWDCANLEVEIGKPRPTGSTIVDTFNEMVMGIFNIYSGNMLQQGNVLAWNVWFDAPSHVDTDEWRDHAEKWRESIDADHGAPDGPGTPARFADGSYFHPAQEAIDRELDAIYRYFRDHFFS